MVLPALTGAWGAVLGSGLLFAILAAVMVATRKVDWYQVATRVPPPRNEPPRHDPQADLHAAYARVRECLREGEPLAWTLRRFERDLLEALGFGFDFASDGDGAPIDPAARYRLDPEQGPLRVLSERTGERRESATGQGLLALAEDAKPPAEDIASLRLPLRAVLLHHLGGRGLKSWEMLGELGRLAARGEMGSE